MYYENSKLPVIETPIHGAAAIQEMLLQSWNNRLRVFPAVSSKWPDVQFHQLRGEGAFLVSGRRAQGQTKWVFVKAESGGSVQVQPQIANARWTTSSGVKVVANDGIYTIDTKPVDWVLFWPVGQAQPKASITPVARRGEEHRFGLWQARPEDD